MWDYATEAADAFGSVLDTEIGTEDRDVILLCGARTIPDCGCRTVHAWTREGWKREALELANIADILVWQAGRISLVADGNAAVRAGEAFGPSPDAATAERFHRLANLWREETAVFSSVSRKAMHPAYQRIIGMGTRAVPLILAELRRQPDHWFWALRAITGEDPVDPEDAGDMSRMAEAWLQLGRLRGWMRE